MVREHHPASDRILAVDARLGAVPFIVAEGAGGQTVKVTQSQPEADGAGGRQAEGAHARTDRTGRGAALLISSTRNSTRHRAAPDLLRFGARTGYRRSGSEVTDSMALDFGEHPDVVFDRAPLITVLCQVKFQPILSLMTLAGTVGFQTALLREYPNLRAAEGVTVRVGPNAVEANSSAPVWRFTDADGIWTVGLAADFVSLETPSYTHIDEFLGRFDRVLRVLHATLRPSPSVRVGLRKVNAFMMPGTTDTRAMITVLRDEMLGPLVTEEFPALITQWYSQLAFRDEDANSLVIRSGLDSVGGEEAVRIILDMDYFSEHAISIGEPEMIGGLLRNFSDGITSFFHWAVRNEFKDSLGPHERNGGVN